MLLWLWCYHAYVDTMLTIENGDSYVFDLFLLMKCDVIHGYHFYDVISWIIICNVYLWWIKIITWNEIMRMIWINWWSGGNACYECVFSEILTHRAYGLSDRRVPNMMCGLVLTYARNLIDQTGNMMTHSNNLNSNRVRLDRV